VEPSSGFIVQGCKQTCAAVLSLNMRQVNPSYKVASSVTNPRVEYDTKLLEKGITAKSIVRDKLNSHNSPVVKPTYGILYCSLNTCENISAKLNRSLLACTCTNLVSYHILAREVLSLKT